MQLFLLNWVKQIKTILSFKHRSLRILADSLRCQCDVHKNIKHISFLVCNDRARQVRLLWKPFKATFILLPTFIIHIFYSICFLALDVTVIIFPDPSHSKLIIKTLHVFCYGKAGSDFGQPHFPWICYLFSWNSKNINEAATRQNNNQLEQEPLTHENTKITTANRIRWNCFVEAISSQVGLLTFLLL